MARDALKSHLPYQQGKPGVFQLHQFHYHQDKLSAFTTNWWLIPLSKYICAHRAEQCNWQGTDSSATVSTRKTIPPWQHRTAAKISTIIVGKHFFDYRQNMSEVDDKLIGSNVLDQERTWFLPIPGFISSTGYRERKRESVEWGGGIMA